MALQPTFSMPSQESPVPAEDPPPGDTAAPGEMYPAEVAAAPSTQIPSDLPARELLPAATPAVAPVARIGSVEFTLTVLQVQVAVDPASRQSETVCTVMLPNGAVVLVTPYTPQDSMALEKAMMEHLAATPPAALPNRRPAVHAAPSQAASQTPSMDNAAASIGASVDRLTQVVTDLVMRNAAPLLPQHPAMAAPSQVPQMSPWMVPTPQEVPAWARPPALPPMQPPVNQMPSQPLAVPPPILRPPPSERGKPTHGPNVAVPWAVIQAAVPAVFSEAPARGGTAGGPRPGTAGRGTQQR